jgi:hypothetical protein
MQCQGRFSEEIDYQKERLWYIRALRIGVFLFNGKLGVGFRRSPPVYFDIKPPTDEAYQDHFFFPEATITEEREKMTEIEIATYTNMCKYNRL